MTQTRIACKKIPLSKSIEFAMPLKRRATCYRQKRSNNCCYQAIKIFMKEKQNDNSVSVSEVVRTVIRKSSTNPC